MANWTAETITSVTTGPGGTRWAAVAKSKEGKHLIVGGEIVETAKRIMRPSFRTDGKVVTQVATDDHYVLIDDAAEECFSSIRQLAVDGAHAYLGMIKPGTFAVVINGETLDTFSDVSDLTVVGEDVLFSASMSGKRGLPAELKGKQVIFLNGERAGAGSSAGSPALSSKGVLAYVRIEKKFEVVSNDEIVAQTDWAAKLAWNTRGDALAWAGRESFYVDGTSHGAHDEIGAFAHHDTETFLYAAQDDGQWSLNGAFQVADLERVSTVDVTDSGRFAAVVKRGGQFFVAIDGEMFGPYETMGLVCADDNAFAYWAATDDGHRLYRDGEPVGDPHRLLSNPVATANGFAAHAVTVDEVVAFSC